MGSRPVCPQLSQWSELTPFFPICVTEPILVKRLFGRRSKREAGASVCQINAFTDEAGNDLITLSQYTCVWGGSREGWRAREDKQSVKSLNHTHYWGNISGARILMYHEEHSLLNGHFTHFFNSFSISQQNKFIALASRWLYFCISMTATARGVCQSSGAKQTPAWPLVMFTPLKQAPSVAHLTGDSSESGPLCWRHGWGAAQALLPLLLFHN